MQIIEHEIGGPTITEDQPKKRLSKFAQERLRQMKEWLININSIIKKMDNHPILQATLSSSENL